MARAGAASSTCAQGSWRSPPAWPRTIARSPPCPCWCARAPSRTPRWCRRRRRGRRTVNPQSSTRIGRYEILTLIGEGGMARVYLAVSRGPVGFNKLVVVKQVRPELAWDRDFITMFFDEARIAARLNHPNVVSTYEVVEEAGQYLLAMEYLEGQTLGEILHRLGRAQMPLDLHLWILCQVL